MHKKHRVKKRVKQTNKHTTKHSNYIIFLRKHLKSKRKLLLPSSHARFTQETDIRYDDRQTYTDQFDVNGFGQTQQEKCPYYFNQGSGNSKRFKVLYFSILT